MNKFLLIFWFFISSLQASRISDLVYQKYHDLLNPPKRIIQRLQPDGTYKEISLPTPLRFDVMNLKTRNVRALLESYEEDCSAVILDRYAHTYISTAVVKDYDDNPLSREIVQRCLAVNPPVYYMELLLKNALIFNVSSVIDMIINNYGNIHVTADEFYENIIKHGRYEIAMRLFHQNRLGIPIAYFAFLICTRCYYKPIDSAINFLRTLITEEVIDVNESTLNTEQDYRYPPLLIATLDCNNQVPGVRENIRKMARLFVEMGADPTLVNHRGQDAFALAELNNHQIFTRIL